MVQIAYKDTKEILGEKIPLTKIPVKKRRLFYPLLKNNVEVTFFQSMYDKSVFGIVLNSFMEVLE